MKVGIIGNASGEIYREAALAFKHLFPFAYTGNENILDPELDTCDVFVVIGNYFVNYQAHRAGPVKKYIAASGKPYIVVTGSLFNAKSPDKYIRLNVNGFCNNYASMPPSSPERLLKLLSFHNIQHIGKHKRGDKIVIAPNALASPMMFGKDVDKWIYFVLDKLDDITDRPIQLRYHRKNIIDHSEWRDRIINKFGDVIDIYTDQKGDKGPLEDAYSVITYNSTFSVLSLLSGSSNVSMHPGNFVYDITKHDLCAESLTHYPSYDQIIGHYGKLANMEWSVDEIKDGTAWKVLGPMIEANEQPNRQWL
jgi:hypothetical protein